MSAPTLSHPGAGSDPDAWVDVTAIYLQSTAFNPDCAFGRVLITFDSVHRNDLFFLDRMASRVCALRGKQILTPNERAALDLVTARPDKSRWQRWRLPESVTDGVPVFLCEVPLFFNKLPGGED